MDNSLNFLFVVRDHLDQDFVHLAIFHHNGLQLDKRTVAQANDLAWHHTEETLLNSLGEVFSINENMLGDVVDLGALAWICWE